MNLVKLPSAFLAVLCLVGCGEITAGIESLFERDPNDFRKSEIISDSPAVADGQSELLMVISLVNSDGNPVKDYRPTYDVIAGTGVHASICTTSNNNGVSTCILKSSQAGTKRVSVTNIQIQLQADLVFENPTKKPIFGFTSASTTQSVGTVQLSGSFGALESTTVNTNGNFKLYGGVQGEAFSQ